MIEDEVKIKILKIENRIAHFTYGDKELMIHLDAVHPAIKYFINNIIDNCETTQWNEVFRVLVCGSYSVLKIPYEIICCPHDDLYRVKGGKGMIVYCCKKMQSYIRAFRDSCK